MGYESSEEYLEGKECISSSSTDSKVRNDSLDLRVRVWINDLHFAGSPSNILTVTQDHQVRLYDVKAQRRPVSNFEIGDHPLIALAMSDSDPK